MKLTEIKIRASFNFQTVELAYETQGASMNDIEKRQALALEIAKSQSDLAEAMKQKAKADREKQYEAISGPKNNYDKYRK